MKVNISVMERLLRYIKERGSESVALKVSDVIREVEDVIEREGLSKESILGDYVTVGKGFSGKKHTYMITFGTLQILADKGYIDYSGVRIGAEALESDRVLDEGLYEYMCKVTVSGEAYLEKLEQGIETGKIKRGTNISEGSKILINIP